MHHINEKELSMC